MQQAQYILDRWMIQIIQDIASARDISFKSYSDDWLLVLNKGAQTRRIIGYKFDLNTSAASAIAADKVASYQILHDANIPVVEHRLVRTKAGARSDWETKLDKIVIKPLDGTSGHAVSLLGSSAEVPEYIRSRPTIAAWTVSPYLNIISETRYIVLNGKVICSYEKQPIVINDLPMFNLGLGATPVVTTDTSPAADMAVAAVEQLGLKLAAVDIIRADGQDMVLEVNDGIMMENFMRVSPEYRAISHAVYDQIVAAQFA